GDDGLRARNVTGVQTCALPIWERTFDRVHIRGADQRMGRLDDHIIWTWLRDRLLDHVSLVRLRHDESLHRTHTRPPPMVARKQVPFHGKFARIDRQLLSEVVPVPRPEHTL